MGDTAPRETGGIQNKLWHRLVLDQELLDIISSTQQPHWESTGPRQDPTPTPHFLIPPPSLQQDSIAFLSQTFYSQFGSSPTQVLLDFVATSRTAASLELPLGKSDTASRDEPGPSGHCVNHQKEPAPSLTENLLTTGSCPH